jgi:hypothetical protein
MTESEARSAILKAYAEKYPEWENVRVPSIIRSEDGIFFALVEAKAGPGKYDQLEEMCWVTKGGRVRIFDGTGDLVHNIADLRSSSPKFFAPHVIAGVAFLLSLAAVIAFTWAGNANQEGLNALTGILGLAAGFYFGNQAAKN